LNITPKSTFDEIYTMMAQNEMAKLSNAGNLSTAEKEKINAEVSQLMTERMQAQLGGISPAPDERLGSFLYRLMKEGLARLENYMGQWFFIGWALIVLVFSFSVGKVYALAMSGLAYLLYQVLLASRFINIYSGTAAKETLDF
ncbi:MAG: hypothetical protein AAB691_05225, partial [Patescibacteria group bacterium]